MSGGVTPHRAGITRQGALGDIWLHLQEGQMWRFDGKETCQLRKPAWRRRHIRGKTSPGVGMPLSFSKKPGGDFKWERSLKSLHTIQFLEGSKVLKSLINLRWRILGCKIQNKEEMNTAGFIACSLSIKARSYQSPPALLKCSELTGK